MTKTRLFIAVALLFAIVSAGVNSVAAQGITTGAIAGTITDENGVGIANAQVQITNRSTGFSTGGLTRDGGYFTVQGLETGGPYTMTVRRIGFQPATRDNLIIALTQTTRVDIKLVQQAAQLSGVTVTAASATSDITPSNMGTKTTVSDTILQRLPTTTRNLTDFIKLTPQVSTTGAGYSGGGMSNRMNNVQIDGATERDVFGLGSTGQPGGQISAKAISIDAVKEFQVLLAPFDVRQGNFGGLLLNAVTKSGTNNWAGSAFRYYRNQDYGRNVPLLRATEFKRDQYGFSLGGPIIKDKLHFFTANEWQRESSPVTGPYRGQPTDATPTFGFSDAEIQQFEAALVAKGGVPGTAGIVNSGSPMDNIFARLDYQINNAHRLVARYNYTDATDEGRRQNARSAQRAIYTSNFHQINSKKKAPVLQLFSNFKNGWNNEAFAGASIVRDRRTPGFAFPQVTVNYSSGRSITAGADEFSQGNELDADTYEFTDNLTIPKGQHNIVLGTRNEYVKIRNLFAQSSLGSWSFANIAAFETGTATGFRKNVLKKDGGNAYFDALQTALYAQDQWTYSPRLTLTMGLRADISNFLTDHEFAPAVDSAFGKRSTPTGALQWSPRVGFNWDATGDQRNQVRGGVGLFVGTPPYVWLENAYVNNGLVQAILDCGTSRGVPDPAPAFTVNVASIQSCANGKGANPVGLVNFVDKDLKFPQPLRANLAYDRVIGTGNVVATVEGLLSRTLNQLFFVNDNLAGPVGRDRTGRVLYGTIATTGVATATRPNGVLANGGAARFPEAINLKNQNKDYAYNITGQLRKRYADNWEALIAYTFSRARDVQSFGSSTHSSNWAFGRTLSAAQEGVYTGVSQFDQPHKIVGLYTRTINWGGDRLGRLGRGLSTDFTLSYQGLSGNPHDYVYGGFGGRGDLNADGRQGNDLIYVPVNANDQNEIRFAALTVSGQTLTPSQQADAFEALINSNKCLRESRGTILQRNTCRLPFSNTWDVQLRQSIPSIMDHRLSVMVDVFNFGNMLNKQWGKTRVSPLGTFSNISLLTHSGNSSADATTAVPIVQYNFLNFDSGRTGQPQPYTIGNFSSNFWRMQLAARYSF